MGTRHGGGATSGTVSVPTDVAREKLAQELWVAYVARLKGLVRALLSARIRRKEGTSAIVQDAFASFFRQGLPPDGAADLWPLLASFARNKVLHAARRYRTQKRSALRELPVSALEGEHSFLEFWELHGRTVDPTPDDALALIELIETLPVDQRFLLDRLLAGAGSAELAQELGCSPRTIERRTRQLREALKRRVSELE